MQGKVSIMGVWCGLKNLSLGITVRHHSASLVMPISDPRDRFFSPHRTPMQDTYCLAHGLGQFRRDTKNDVSCLQVLLTRHNEDLQMTFGVGRHTRLIVNIMPPKELRVAY